MISMRIVIFQIACTETNSVLRTCLYGNNGYKRHTGVKVFQTSSQTQEFEEKCDVVTKGKHDSAENREG